LYNDAEKPFEKYILVLITHVCSKKTVAFLPCALLFSGKALEDFWSFQNLIKYNYAFTVYLCICKVRKCSYQDAVIKQSTTLLYISHILYLRTVTNSSCVLCSFGQISYQPLRVFVKDQSTLIEQSVQFSNRTFSYGYQSYHFQTRIIFCRECPQTSPTKLLLYCLPHTLLPAPTVPSLFNWKRDHVIIR